MVEAGLPHRSPGHLRESQTVITIRLATASDAGAVAAIIGEGFASYRAWAPADWTPPAVGEGDPGGFAKALANADVWFMVAESGGSVLGHVALALSTHEDLGLRRPARCSSGNCSYARRATAAVSPAVSCARHSPRLSTAASHTCFSGRLRGPLAPAGSMSAKGGP